MDRSERLAIARQVSDQLQKHYQGLVKAVGIFGSVARAMDGPFSDVELHCVLAGENAETVYEWATGPWKCLVGVYSKDVLLRDAAIIDETWPFVQSGYVFIEPLYDPEDLFPGLREIVLRPRPNEFKQAIRDLIVGEVSETIGKIRNADEMGKNGSLPMLAMEFSKWGACLIGLANRHLYNSFSTMFEESLEVPGRPDGYDGLCELVTSGRLENHKEIVNRANDLWRGIEAWASENGIRIYDTLDALLSESHSMEERVKPTSG